MTRQPDIPFPDSAATWDKKLKILTVPAVHKIDPTIRSVAIDLAGGNINVKGIVPQNSSVTPTQPELSAKLQIKARTERKAREKLAKERNNIQITTSSEGVTVTQEADTTIPTRREIFYSNWRTLAA